MIIIIFIAVILSNQLHYSQDYSQDIERSLKLEAADIIFNKYCNLVNALGKDCSITIDEFSEKVHLENQFRLGYTDIHFYYYTANKYLDEVSPLFIKKDSIYFHYDDFSDPGMCFTDKTETLFNRIINNQSITENNIFELINFHLIYRNMNNQLYEFLYTIDPNKNKIINSCSLFDVVKSDNGNITISFLIWNSLSTYVYEVIMKIEDGKIKITTTGMGKFGTPRLKI